MSEEAGEKTKVKKVKSKKSEKEAPASGDAAPARSTSKKRAQRSGSNVFAMFTQNQVATFKEAFGFIDSDKDGIISKNDIRATFDALGRLCTEKELEEMASEAPGPINFTTFLTIFGDRAQGTDDEDVIAQAFNLYDEGDGFCKEEHLKHALCTWGEKFSQKECDEIFAEAPTNMEGKVDIKKFVALICRGNQEEEEAAA